MDIIIDWQLYETEFAGEKISMEIRMLRSWAMFALEPYLNNPNPKKEEETAKEYAARLTDEEKTILSNNSRKIQEISEKILPDHVQNIKGITVNGEPVTWEQIAAEVVFLNLAVEICGQLASISTLKKADEKNSEGVLHLRESVSGEAS